MTAPFIGLNIAKDHIDIGQWPERRTWQIPHTTEGINQLAAQFTDLEPACIVLVDSGGYEQQAAAILASAGLPVAVVNPRQVHDLARATGQLAKTDRLDALILAHFAEAVRPATRPLPDAAAEELRTLLLLRSQVVAMIAAEKNRLKQAGPAVRSRIKAHIAWLEDQRDELDDALRTCLKQTLWWEKEEQYDRSST